MRLVRVRVLVASIDVRCGAHPFPSFYASLSSHVFSLSSCANSCHTAGAVVFGVNTTALHLIMTSHSSLLELPPELLHRIFSFLEDGPDISAARATCSLLAVVGADYLLEMIPLVWKSQRMQRLFDIAHHPVLSQRVRSLYFQADRLKPGMTFKEWDRIRHIPVPEDECDPTQNEELLQDMPDKDMPGEDQMETERTQRVYIRAIRKFMLRLKGHYTKAQLLDAYREYCLAVLDQRQVDVHRMDINALTTLFERCPKLDHVTIALGHGTQGTLDAATYAFKEGLCYPYGDATYANPVKTSFDDNPTAQGSRQFYGLAEAILRSGTRLRHLTAIDISYTVLQNHGRDFERVRAMMRYLRELRLGFDCYLERGDSRDHVEYVWLHAHKYLADRGLKQYLSAAPELRVLKLSLPRFPLPWQWGPTGNFEDCVGDISWTKLREFGITAMDAKEDELVDFLLRHKRTLRRLSLSNLSLTQGSWVSLFERIAGKLPNLKKVRLRGRFDEERFGGVLFDFLRFDGPGGPRALESRKVSPLRDAFENFILHGGKLPLGRKELPYEERIYPWHLPGYEPPDIEEDGYISDGSAIEYTEDDFDLSI